MCHHPHTHFYDTLPTSDRMTDGGMIIQDATRAPSLPPMLHTARQSRYVGLRNYTKVSRVLFNANLLGGLLERDVYVNFSCDIIRFPEYTILNAVKGRPHNSLTWGFRAVDLGKFRHVEVETACVDMFYQPLDNLSDYTHKVLATISTTGSTSCIFSKVVSPIPICSCTPPF